MKKIQTNDLTPGAFIVVEGVVEYSKVSNLMSQAEIDRLNTKLKFPITEPMTQITISGVDENKVRVAYPDGVKGNEETEKEYILQKCYSYKTEDKDRGLYFSTRAKRIPRVYFKEKDNNEYDVIELDGELEKGTPIQLVLRVYSTSMNNGVGFEAIALKDEIRYFRPSNEVMLEKLGIKIRKDQPVRKISNDEPNEMDDILGDLAEELFGQ